jgi:hypothetical protein
MPAVSSGMTKCETATPEPPKRYSSVGETRIPMKTMETRYIMETRTGIKKAAWETENLGFADSPARNPAKVLSK